MSNVLHARYSLSKSSTNRLNQSIFDKQIKDITNCTLNRPTAKDVKVLAENISVITVKNGFEYSFEISMGKVVARSEITAQKNMEAAQKLLFKAAEMRGFSVRSFADVEQAKSVAEDRPKFTIPKLTEENIKKYFNGVYEREPHIRLIQDIVNNCVLTNFEDRNHILLWGPPATAKSVLFNRFKKFYEDGSDIERVMIINSTTTSKVGLENMLLDKAKDKILPEIICFDEVEKVVDENLHCLLSVMDQTATISRNNAKIGRQSAEAKCLVVATCNDIDKLKNFASGALYSRFSTRLPCARPKRELMRNILIAQLQERIDAGEDAKLEWADAAIDYAYDVMKVNCPRTIKGLLSGRDRLLDKSYFKDLESIEKSFNESVASKAT